MRKSKIDIQSGSCNFEVFSDENTTVVRSSFSHGSVLVGSENDEVFLWKKNRRVCNGLLVRLRRESIGWVDNRGESDTGK